MAVIFAEQTLNFAYDSNYGVYVNNSNPSVFLPIAGKTYRVVWDGTEYVVTAISHESFPGQVLMGNQMLAGGENTGQPFAMASLEDGGGMTIFALDAKDTHVIAVYLVEDEVPDEPEVPEGIVLKDHAGNDIIYECVKSITVPTSDGGTKRFVVGNLVEKTVDLSMADGNMVIESEEDTVLNKVTVKKPETLIPENIAKDVNIGGVVGTHEGGGSSGDYTITIIDYDGTVLLEEKHATGDVFTLPNAPAHERLVFDGWSASVPVADNTVTVEESDIMVGAMYRTASGATECDIYLNAATGLTFGFSGVLTGYTSIDWGDGVIDSSLSHTYDDYGEYTIKIYGMTKIASTSSSNAFVPTSYGESLVQCFIANTVTSIGSYAFYLCYSLRSVSVPSSVTSIGKCAWHMCYSLSGIVIPIGVTSIEVDLLYSCYSLSSVVIPIGVTSIGKEAFYSCFSLSNIVIPIGVTSIGSYAFYSCFSLSNIVIPIGVTSIGSYAFQYCRSLKSIVIPSGVTTIPTYAFQYCVSLESIVIPSSVTSIGSYAFQQCNSLKSIVIPSGVTTIPTYAFQYFRVCMIYDFSRHTKVPTLSNTNAFSGIRKTAKIKVPTSLYNTWKTASNWSTYANNIVAV